MTFPSFHDPTHLYFITASVIAWKHIFIKDEYAKIVSHSLDWMQQQKQILLFAFVVMPSHVHVILKPESDPIGDILQQFGSFTAHEVLKKLREQNENNLLHLFQQNKRDQRHEHSIW
jgi:putative transposase